MFYYGVTYIYVYHNVYDKQWLLLLLDMKNTPQGDAVYISDESTSKSGS